METPAIIGMVSDKLLKKDSIIIMKIIKIIPLLFCIVNCSTAFCSVDCIWANYGHEIWGPTTNELKISIYTDKSNYSLNEPVIVCVHLYIFTDRPIILTDVLTRVSAKGKYGFDDLRFLDASGNIVTNIIALEDKQKVIKPGLNNVLLGSIREINIHSKHITTLPDISLNEHYALNPGDYTLQIVADKWKDKDGNVLKSNALKIHISDEVYVEKPEIKDWLPVPGDNVDGLTLRIAPKREYKYAIGERIEVDYSLCNNTATATEYSLPGGFHAQELMLFNEKGENLQSDKWNKMQKTDRIPLDRMIPTILDDKVKCDNGFLILNDYYPNLQPGSYFVQMRWKILHDGSEKFIRSSKQKIIILPTAEGAGK